MTLKSEYNSANYLLRLIPGRTTPKRFIEQYSLSTHDVAILNAAVSSDGLRFIYNGCVSFLSALASLERQTTTWAISQLYYSVFYFARAALCRRGIVVFHVPKEDPDSHTQFTLQILVGSKAVIDSDFPSTHKLVASIFKKLGYPSFMQNLQIEGSDPISWMRGKREFWQYRCGRFPDPDYPDELEQINLSKLSLLLENYSNDNTGVYLADISHALVALPFRLLEWSLRSSRLLLTGVVEQTDVDYLKKLCRIKNQRLTSIERLLSQ